MTRSRTSGRSSEHHRLLVVLLAVTVGLAVAQTLVLTLGSAALRGALTLQMVFQAAHFLTGLACLLVAARIGPAARAWAYFGVAELLFGTGQVLWYAPRGPEVGTVWLDDLAYVLSWPLVLTGLFTFFPRASSRLFTTRLALDVGITTLTLAAYVWYFLGHAFVRDFTANPLGASLALLYPSLGVLFLSLLLIAVHARGTRPTRSEVLLLIAGTGIIVETFVCGLLREAGVYDAAHPINALYTWDAVIVMLAALTRLSEQREKPGPLPTMWLKVLPVLPYGAMFAMQGLAITSFIVDVAAVRAGVIGWSTVLMLLVIARHFTANIERDQLVRALQEAAGSLEAKVEQRTRALTQRSAELDQANRELAELSATLEQQVRERTAELEASRAHLAFQATHDALTGLPNRTLFEERLAVAVRQGVDFGVLFTDLDGFKAVNDSLGHRAGDQLLVEFARRARASLRTGDVMARISGDEFAALILPAGEETPAQVAQRLLLAMNTPVDLPEGRVVVGVSVGVALFPHDGLDGATLLRHADAAMYQAKRQGKGGVQRYSPDDTAVVPG